MNDQDSDFEVNIDTKTEIQQSKTQVKKALLEITHLGQKLIEQPLSTLNKLPLDDTILDAITQAKTMKRIALKRQIGYLGKLLRNSPDIEQIISMWHAIEAEQNTDKLAFHQIEAWRKQLISQDKQQLELFFDQYPQADRQQIRQLAKRAQKEIQENKETKHAYKALFQEIKNIIETADN